MKKTFTLFVSALLILLTAVGALLYFDGLAVIGLGIVAVVLSPLFLVLSIIMELFRRSNCSENTKAVITFFEMIFVIMFLFETILFLGLKFGGPIHM